MVFIIFFKGESLRQIIDKVCDGYVDLPFFLKQSSSFHARQYPCPKTSIERQDALIDVITRIQDHGVIIESTSKQRFDVSFFLLL